jgi:hypothetical protein
VAHAPGLQFFPLSNFAQAPPLQNPVVPQVDCGVVAQWPWGSGEPSATGLHKPSDPDRLQALHASVHAPVQQTPWAQNPDTHSLAALQSAPMGLRPHELLMQWPLTHWLSAVHEAKQLFILQV